MSSPAPDQLSPGNGFRIAVVSLPEEREAVLSLLKQSLGMNAVDAKIRIQQVPTVWPEQHSAEQAEAAAVQLRALGAVARAVPVAEIRQLNGQTLHHVRCLPDGFVVVSLTGEAASPIPWQKLKLISVAEVGGLQHKTTGAFPDTTFRRQPMHAMPTASKSTEFGLEFWLLFAEPAALYRIDANLMNYEYLGERLKSSTPLNAKALFQDLVHFAPHAMLTPTAGKFADEKLRQTDRVASTHTHHDIVLARGLCHSGE